MSSYMLRQVDRDDLQAFRARCAEHGLKPDDVLRAFIAGATLDYHVMNDRVQCEFRAGCEWRGARRGGSGICAANTRDWDDWYSGLMVRRRRNTRAPGMALIATGSTDMAKRPTAKPAAPGTLKDLALMIGTKVTGHPHKNLGPYLHKKKGQ